MLWQGRVNERNVAALEEILNSNVLFRYTQKLASRRELAIYLADSGVLAVPALTDNDTVKTFMSGRTSWEGVLAVNPNKFRAILALVAKGEA
jgi:hypothetical protein